MPFDQYISATGSCPVSRAIIDAIIAKKPLHRRFLLSALNQLTEPEKNEAEHYIGYLLRSGLKQEDIVVSYLTIVEDTYREELYFRANGRYRCSTYAEAAEMVYNNPGYMERYMLGLALSSYWWPNHVQLRRFFLTSLPKDKVGLYLEVGPGHGLYFLAALRNSNFDVYQGLDISPTSVRLTSGLINSGFFGHFPNAEIREGDFFTTSLPAKAEALVMGEVLEHVEAPGRFLRRAYEATSARPFVFVTTCINSPAIDHLYNPETLAALESLITASGFKIAGRCLAAGAGRPLDVCWRERLPVNVAFVLEK